MGRRRSSKRNDDGGALANMEVVPLVLEVGIIAIQTALMYYLFIGYVEEQKKAVAGAVNSMEPSDKKSWFQAAKDRGESAAKLSLFGLAAWQDRDDKLYFAMASAFVMGKSFHTIICICLKHQRSQVMFAIMLALMATAVLAATCIYEMDICSTSSPVTLVTETAKDLMNADPGRNALPYQFVCMGLELSLAFYIGGVTSEQWKQEDRKKGGSYSSSSSGSSYSDDYSSYSSYSSSY